MWWQCLLTDWDRMSNLYRGLSIDVSYQISDHLAKRFQKRRFLEIDQSETRITCGGHALNVSGQNEHSLWRTTRRCFLPSFGSFGQAVSEEKNLKNQPIRNKTHLW
jgi:predicted GIY-YIG superfamily endonuclease